MSGERQRSLQKADLNKDGLFDRQELNTFVRSLLPAALHPRTLDQDTLDTAALLAEKAFDQAGPDSEDRLSFRGSLLQRPPAAVLGEGLVNMLVDLADQVDGLEDDFSRSGLRARRAQ